MQGVIKHIEYDGQTVKSVDVSFARAALDLHIVTLEKIGEGSFGTVYRATTVDHPRFKNFALKIASGKPARLLQEISVMTKVCTKGRLQTVRFEFAAVNEPEANLIAVGLELCLPLTLHDFLVSYRLTSEPEMLYLAYQVVQAVTGVHDEDCCHRDIKLQNFVFDLDCNVKLIDFGLAYGSITPPPGDLVAGTVSFMSPEMASNALNKSSRVSVGSAADVWSVGIVIFSIVTQRNPYPSLARENEEAAPVAEDSQTLLRRVAKGQWQWPTGLFVSADVKALVESMLVVSPAARPTLRQVMQLPVWNGRRRMPPTALQSFLGLEGFESLLAPSPEHQQCLLRNVERKSHIISNLSRANSVAAPEESQPHPSSSQHNESQSSDLDASMSQRIVPSGRQLEKEFNVVMQEELKKKSRQRSKSKSVAPEAVVAAPALESSGKSSRRGSRARSAPAADGASAVPPLLPREPSVQLDVRDPQPSEEAAAPRNGSSKRAPSLPSSAVLQTGSALLAARREKSRSRSLGANPELAPTQAPLVNNGMSTSDAAAADEPQTKKSRVPVVTIDTPSSKKRSRSRTSQEGDTARGLGEGRQGGLLGITASALAAAERKARTATARVVAAQHEQLLAYLWLRIEEDQSRYNITWLADANKDQVDHPHVFKHLANLTGKKYEYGYVCDICQGEYVPSSLSSNPKRSITKFEYYHCTCGMDVCPSCIATYQSKCTCRTCNVVCPNTQELRRHKCAAASKQKVGAKAATAKRDREGTVVEDEPKTSKRKTEVADAKVAITAGRASSGKTPNEKPTKPAASTAKVSPPSPKPKKTQTTATQPSSSPTKKTPSAAQKVPQPLKKLGPIAASVLSSGPWKPDFSKVIPKPKIAPPSDKERAMLLGNEWIRYFHFYPKAPAKGSPLPDAFVYHIQPGRTGAILLSNASPVHSVVLSLTERSLLVVSSIDPTAAASDGVQVMTLVNGKTHLPAQYALAEAAATADSALIKQRRSPGTVSVYQAPTSAVRSVSDPFLYVRWFRVDETHKIAAFLLSSGGVQVFVGSEYELRWREESRRFIVRSNGVCEAVDSSFPMLSVVDALLQETIDDDVPSN